MAEDYEIHEGVPHEAGDKPSDPGGLKWAGKVGAIVIAVFVGAIMLADHHVEQNFNAAAPASGDAAPPAAAQPKPLNPIFADAMQCFRQCEGGATAPEGKGYNGPVPYQFSDYLLSNPEAHTLFLDALKELPQEWIPLGVLREGEGDQLFMNGAVTAVLRWKGRAIYIYGHPGYVQGLPNRYPAGYINLAVDPETKEYAGILNYNSDLSGYRFFGNREILRLLVAYQAADEAETEKANKISRTELPQSVVFPIPNDRIDYTTDRLLYLASLYSDKSDGVSGAKSAYAAGDVGRASVESRWFAASTSGGCSESVSPATRIQQIRDSGYQPSTKDENDASGNPKSVEV